MTMKQVRNIAARLGVLAVSFVFSVAGARGQGRWTGTNSMNAARSGQTATLLTNGRVLVAGGENSVGNVRAAEFYNPSTGSWAVTGQPNVARAWPRPCGSPAETYSRQGVATPTASVRSTRAKYTTPLQEGGH